MDPWQLFVAAAVARYKPGGKFWTDNPEIPAIRRTIWQVYNEQNIPAFWPNWAVAEQVRGVPPWHAPTTIRGADPTAKIMLGGMHGDEAMNGTPSYDFLRQLYERTRTSKGWDDFDIVAVHPYGFSTSEMTTEIDKVRAAMAEGEDSSAPIWVTEMGWASAFDSDDPEGRSGGSASRRARRAC